MNKISNNAVYEIILSYQKTAALNAAIKLDIFTTIGKHCLTVEQIADVTGGSLRGVAYFVTSFVSLVCWKRTQISITFQWFLDRSSPHCLADAIDFLAVPVRDKGRY